MQEHTKLHLKPEQRGRLLADVRVGLKSESIEWKVTNHVVVIDPERSLTPLDVMVVPCGIGIALVEFSALKAENDERVGHVFEVTVSKDAEAEEVVGRAITSFDNFESDPTGFTDDYRPFGDDPEASDESETQVSDPGLMAGQAEDAVNNEASAEGTSEIPAPSNVVPITAAASDPSASTAPENPEPSNPNGPEKLAA